MNRECIMQCEMWMLVVNSRLQMFLYDVEHTFFKEFLKKCCWYWILPADVLKPAGRPDNSPPTPRSLPVGLFTGRLEIVWGGSHDLITGVLQSDFRLLMIIGKRATTIQVKKASTRRNSVMHACNQNKGRDYEIKWWRKYRTRDEN